MVRFSKFGAGSLVGGIVLLAITLNFLYAFTTEGLINFGIDTLIGSLNLLGIGLIILGILLFVL